VMWLDEDLIRSRSADCWRLIRGIDPLDPVQVGRLAELYQGRFAIDFAYEDWAISFRDSLHAAYLQVIETAIAADSASGHFDRGISIAQRALAVDPTADHLEASLVRLYRMSGAHAAAAEQYAHYAAVLREDLGVSPPSIDAV
jgi:DNA-binding SARP family transcriptional activator